MQDTTKLIRRGLHQAAIRKLVQDSLALRRSVSPRAWREHAVPSIREPELVSFAHRCHMTRRSYEKPRGYSGDAVVLDHIYGTGEGRMAPHPASPEGQVYAYTVNAPAPAAVRYRREVLARLIDEAAERCGAGRATVVSFACGHLREAELSVAIREHRLGHLLAMDQDEASLEVVRQDYGTYGVDTRLASVKHILSGRQRLPRCDLIYAAGLYDYLDDRLGARLLEIMTSALNPRGKVLVANFLPNIPDAGYMEAFMDWWLVYRDMDAVLELFKTLPPEMRGRIETFFDPGFNIAFAVMERP